jgi:hypothetical protein
MSDFTVRSDSVNVEQIMEQIRERIRAKRGVDYTEEQIREMAAVKLAKFLDPKVVRSDLLQEFQRSQAVEGAGRDSLFYSPRPWLRSVRELLRPILKLFVNPDALRGRSGTDQLYYELFHNLVLELTRASIEIKNLKMQIESLTGRLEFNERRARALESVVVYRPDETDGREFAPRPHGMARADSGSSPGQADVTPPAPLPGPAPGVHEGPGQRSRRRRRRRGRRGAAPAAAIMSASAGSSELAADSPADVDREQDAETHSPEATLPPAGTHDQGPDDDR